MAFRLSNDETVTDSIRRIVLEQVDKAADSLGKEKQSGVHNARKCFKRVRSILRLLRTELGNAVYKKENKWFGHISRQLSSVRDAQAMVEAFDRLSATYPELSVNKKQLPVRDWLVERQQSISDKHININKLSQEIAKDLRKNIPKRVDKWKFKHSGFKVLAVGFDRNYRRGRQCMKKASRNGIDELFHDWRKRVKDLWYHCTLLRDMCPDFLDERIAQLDELSDILGAEHDLQVLLQLMDQAAGDIEGIEVLRVCALREQQELRQRGFDLGKLVYAEKPAAMISELSAYWKEWRQKGSLSKSK